MLDITEIELEFPVLRWAQECRLVLWLRNMLIKEMVFSGILASDGLCGHLIEDEMKSRRVFDREALRNT